MRPALTAKAGAGLADLEHLSRRVVAMRVLVTVTRSRISRRVAMLVDVCDAYVESVSEAKGWPKLLMGLSE
jgi:hypothetical protein